MKIDLSAFMAKVLIAAWAFFLPVKSALIAVAFLVLIDFVTGIWASLKDGTPITSKGFGRSVTKVLAYQTAIIAAFVLETYLMDGIPVTKAVTGLIGVTEGKSFFENINRITGIDFWAMLVSSLNLPGQKKDDK